jgi:signal transduction histidine kinase/ActR/RegA family two-component response regulator
MPKRVLPVRSWSLLAGFGLLAVVVGAAALFVELQESSDLRIRQSLSVEAGVAEALSVVQGAEIGQRGYLLTGNRTYLEPYERAITELGGTLAKLSAATENMPAQREKFAQLRGLINAKLAELQATIARREAGDAVGALAIVHGDGGEKLGQDIRNLIRAMRATEAERLKNHLSEAADLANLLRLGILLAAIILALLAAYTIRQTRQRATTIIRQRDELQTANQALLFEKSTREAAESQVRQMQKMEAMGQLTGGVAHDFNNMLAVILGSFELMQNRLSKGDTDIARFIEAGMDAAQRAATLTQRLLAFSRQQALAPRGLDPNRLVQDMSNLLRRTLGADIVIESVLTGGLWRVFADQGQLENAIVNLCVNARDAMPGGGKLTIETANVQLDEKYAREHGDVAAGQYVMIAISDNGTGMEADVARRAFDPFFTTKDVGRGTGLGLSQVYGFVKQSGGHIKIYSEVGQGTSVKIYLPRYLGALEEEPPARSSVPLPTGSETEVVLVVEDEERMRDLSVTALKELGYKVIAADGAEAALRHLDETPGIRLLFTDIVMPEVNGRKLAEEALRRRPDLKVLYTTGFTRNAVVHGGVLDHGVELLQKPFTLEELATKVRAILGAAPAPAESQGT